MAEYETVIGLEVHARLETRSKLFCGCPNVFGKPPNTLTCPVCLGYPGALPVLNDGAVALALKGALALGCTPNLTSVFARKNYFYPDLPKGYQITQFDAPLASGGAVEIEVDGASRSIRLARYHLEEDAGKLVHEGGASGVDLNRAGVPLVEIVSEPDVRGPEEAYLFLQRLRSVLRYAEVCTANLEEGSMRCDANVSLRPAGSASLGTRTELKNLNSFRNLQRALEYEVGRQARLLDSGEAVVQETVLWDAARGVTRPMRSKEEAHDYRYFPEPDLPALVLDAARVDRLRSELPELPAARKRRLATAFHLPEADVHQLTLERSLAEFFEEAARRSGNPRAAANFVLNDLLRAQKAAGRDESDIAMSADHLAELVRLIDEATISVSAARALFDEVHATGRAPRELVRRRGLEQVSSPDALREIVRKVVEEHSEQVRLYKAGKTGILGFLVGRAMKASGGKANPEVLHRLLRESLDPPEASP